MGACLACAALVALFAIAASAAVVHPFDRAFGPDGTSSTAFGRPAALAVDQSTGVVYLADLSANKVLRFDSADQPANFSALGSNEIGGFSFNSEGGVSQIAVNSTSGIFYVVDNLANKVKAFKANGEPAEFSALGSSELGGFGELCGVAVDQNGDIYAGDYFASAVKVYSSNGESLASLNTAEPCNVAVDSHGAVYANAWHGSVSKFTPSAFPVTASTTYASAGVIDSNSAFGLAVDPGTDDVYVDEGTKVARYDETGALTETLGASGDGALSESEGVAIDDASGNIYISDAGGAHQVEVFRAVHTPNVTTGAASNIANTSATVAGTISADSTEPSDALTACEFEYGITTGYGQSAECVPGFASIPTDESSHSVSADLSGLTPGVEYHYRLRGANGGGAIMGQDATFVTPSPPFVETTGSPMRTATTARLEGRVDPLGLAATYRFEYGDQGPCDANPCTATATQAAGSASLTELVSQRVPSLQPDTTYHYRVVADNGNPAGPAFGEDMTVTTRSSDASLSHGTLPGPPGSDRAWEQVSTPNAGGNRVNAVTGISDDGSRVTYLPIGGTPESTNGSAFNELFAERTAGGWKTSAILPPRVEAPGNNWLEPAGASDLSQLFSVNSGSTSGGEASGWMMRPHAAATKLFGVPNLQWGQFAVVSDNALRVVSTFVGSLDPAHPAVPSTVNLYDVTSGTPHLISLMPGGAVPTCGVEAGALPSPLTVRREPHWVSADGSLAFFPSRGNSCGEGLQLYVRDLAAGETKLVSGPPISGPDCGGIFIKSTPGAAFLWTQSRLDPSDTAVGGCGGESNGDVYRYDVGSGALRCLTCVVPGVPATVQRGSDLTDVATEIAVAEDGSRVYFSSPQVLVPGAAPAAPGDLDAYRVDVAGGNLAYVAHLGLGPTVGDAARASNAITPDGSVLIFKSADPSLNPLNGLDNGGTEQYYRYDDRDRSLVCVSCPQDGTAPRGAVHGTPSGRLVEGQQLGPDVTPLDERGDVFAFNTPTPLVSADQNTAGPSQGPFVGTDVYEWRDGRQLLISDGLTGWPDSFAGEGAPRAAGVSRSGSDVFLIAAAQYTPDALESYDRVYDARIGGGFSFPVAPPPCQLEVCQGIPRGAPQDVAPGTSSFSGPGNVKPHPPRKCPRGKIRRRGHCVAKHHKRSRRAHHRGANRNRRSAR
jgi:hypothetical protein